MKSRVEGRVVSYWENDLEKWADEVLEDFKKKKRNGSIKKEKR